MIVIPILIAGLTGTAALVKHRRDKLKDDPRVQAQREAIYINALNNVKDPAALRHLAQAFADQGMTAEADMLSKRAALQELPEEVKAQRKQIFHDAMKYTDPEKVYALADAFHSQGATGAAENLRAYASGLTAAATVPATEEKADEPSKE